jgi:sialic acid synthase SpsE
MKTMECAFKLPVGYSDHTIGSDISLAAIALGAQVLEKHFTLDKKMDGPDHSTSIDSDELRELVGKARSVESAMGSGIKMPVTSEQNVSLIARRSLFADRDIPAGKIIEPKDIVTLRPSGGICPSMVDFIIGKRVNKTLKHGDMIRFIDIN